MLFLTPNGDRNFGGYTTNMAYFLTGKPTPPCSDWIPGFEAGVEGCRIELAATTAWVMDNVHLNNGQDGFKQNSHNTAFFSNSGGGGTLMSTNPPRLHADGFAANGSKWGGVCAIHLETLNVLYCDGHVKAQKIESLIKTATVNYGSGDVTIMPAFTIEDD